MKIFKLYYPEWNYTLEISPSERDYIGYLWEKEKGEKFDYNNFHQYKRNKLYKELKEKYKNNEINKGAINQSKAFQQFLYDKYEQEVSSIVTAELFSETEQNLVDIIEPI